MVLIPSIFDEGVKAKYLYYFIGLILVVLIGVQLYWILNGIRLQKTALERDLKDEIATIVKQVEEDAYCVDFYSKAYIKKGEGIYVLKHEHKDNKFLAGKADTLSMYNVFYMENDTLFSSDKAMLFNNYAATVDINYKFRLLSPTRIKRQDTNSYDVKNLNEGNFKELLTNKNRVDEKINLHLLDSLIKNTLAKHKLDTGYKAGIKKEGSKKYEYLKPGTQTADLQKASITARFLDDHFSEPYVLSIVVPNSFRKIVQSMSAIMVTSIIIIIILIISYAYFVRTILNQKRLSEMKNTFINNITHEFRTPITNINLAVENWRENKSNDAFYMGIIADENQHMERNVEQILQLATLEHADDKKHFCRVNVHSMIQDTGQAFNIQLAQVKGSIEYRLDAKEYFIKGDSEQIRNLLYNLIDNSIKYRSEAPQITVATYNTGSELAIEVEDNGIGITAETQQYIFDRFYRGYTGDTHNVKGFGLGLSFVKYIVDVHKGRIEVKSKPGKGSKFTVYLPIY